jgi:hypothetical protein
MTMHGGKGWPCASTSFLSVLGSMLRTYRGKNLHFHSIAFSPLLSESLTYRTSAKKWRKPQQDSLQGHTSTLGRNWARTVACAPLPLQYKPCSASNPSRETKNFMAYSCLSCLPLAICTTACPARPPLTLSFTGTHVERTILLCISTTRIDAVHAARVCFESGDPSAFKTPRHVGNLLASFK